MFSITGRHLLAALLISCATTSWLLVHSKSVSLISDFASGHSLERSASLKWVVKRDGDSAGSQPDADYVEIHASRMEPRTLRPQQMGPAGQQEVGANNAGEQLQAPPKQEDKSGAGESQTEIEDSFKTNEDEPEAETNSTTGNQTQLLTGPLNGPAASVAQTVATSGEPQQTLAAPNQTVAPTVTPNQTVAPTVTPTSETSIPQAKADVKTSESDVLYAGGSTVQVEAQPDSSKSAASQATSEPGSSVVPTSELNKGEPASPQGAASSDQQAQTQQPVENVAAQLSPVEAQQAGAPPASQNVPVETVPQTANQPEVRVGEPQEPALPPQANPNSSSISVNLAEPQIVPGGEQTGQLESVGAIQSPASSKPVEAEGQNQIKAGLPVESGEPNSVRAQSAPILPEVVASNQAEAATGSVGAKETLLPVAVSVASSGPAQDQSHELVATAAEVPPQSTSTPPPNQESSKSSEVASSPGETVRLPVVVSESGQERAEPSPPTEQANGASELKHDDLANTVGSHANPSAQANFSPGENSTISQEANEIERLEYRVDGASCANVPQAELNATIELILSTLGSENCSSSLAANSIRLRPVTNTQIGGHVMEVSSMPLELGQLVSSRMSQVSCIKQHGAKPRLRFDHEPSNQWLSSRWRLYPKLRLNELPIEMLRSASYAKGARSRHSKAGRNGSSGGGGGLALSKCQRFKVESGQFYLELMALKTSLIFETDLGHERGQQSGAPLEQQAASNGKGPKVGRRSAQQNLGVRLVEFQVRQVYLDHALKLDADLMSEGPALTTSQLIRRPQQTAQILHSRNDHYRRNNWLLDLYGNWLKHEYRSQLAPLFRGAEASRVRAHLGHCFQ